MFFKIYRYHGYKIAPNIRIMISPLLGFPTCWAAYIYHQRRYHLDMKNKDVLRCFALK